MGRLEAGEPSPLSREPEGAPRRVRACLLVMEPNEALHPALQRAFSETYDMVFAKTCPDAVALFRKKRPPVVLLDLGLAPASDQPPEGLRTLAEMRQSDSRAKVIVVSDDPDRAHAIKAIDHGAYDFFVKPFDLDEMRVALRRALHLFQLEEENREIRRLARAQCALIGNSRPIQEVESLIRKAAATDISVLITGESGTGKERAARAIHQESARRAGPFVAIHCGAIPENLLESELFGHEKGAFTGAHMQRKGRIECAAGGTLFLDEIGDMGTSLQVKLLRFLQDGMIERVGGREAFPANTRVIAATHRDLQTEMERGGFRLDLFYRLNGIAVHLPPLRERENDALTLAHMFLERYAREVGKRIGDLSEDARQAIATYRWPGNVRELENKIKRGVIMAEGAVLTAEDMEMTTAKIENPTLKDALKKLERDLIFAACQRYGGNVTQAAQALGITRQALHKIMKRLGLSPQEI